MRTQLVFFVALVSLLWAANSPAGDVRDDPEEQASREVIARLQLRAEAEAKVDAVFAQYQGKIDARQYARDTALLKWVDAGWIGSEDAEKAAEEKLDKEQKLYTTAIHERDSKVKQALPPALALKFERGMKLVAERQAKLGAVLSEGYEEEEKKSAKEEKKKVLVEYDKKYDAIKKEYDKKLDAEVGRLNEQK